MCFPYLFPFPTFSCITQLDQTNKTLTSPFFLFFVSQDRNIVLQYTYEYRQPSAAQRAKAAAESEAAGEQSVKMELIHRYLGLVVVPGEHIVKIEKEDFASQLK